MKKLVALVLAFAITPAFAGTVNADYTVCKALAKEKYPEANVKVKKVRSSTITLKLLFPNEITSVECDRASLSLGEKR